jgi:hypothetical protein
MKKFGMTVLLSSLALMCLTMQVQAQDAAAGIDQEEMMKKWQAFMTPGEEHALLKEREGTWNMTIKMWMDPSAPPTVSEGSSVVKMIMGGRYLVDHTKSTFDGMPFEGMSIVGYDNMKKKFVSNWIDNMGTGILSGHGTYDESTKTFNYEMKGPDVMTGKYEKMRSIEKLLSKDEWVTEMFRVLPDGKEIKSMEITYKRAK